MATPWMACPWTTEKTRDDGAAARRRRVWHRHKVDGKHKIGQREFRSLLARLTIALLTLPRQRAFRERKERHVKDLEQKLTTLEQTSTSLHADNERLKRELAKIATENEILRATSGSHTNGHLNGHGHSPSHHSPITTTGPLSFSPTDFYSSVLHPHHSKTPSHRITVSETTGERLLAAGATWDLIQSHELFKRGLVDVGDVCERLKRVAKCDGQGPVFEEGDVRRAIEESVAGGSDELIWGSPPFLLYSSKD
jgi:AP-1-like factor